MSASIHIRLPPASFFHFPPSPLPETIPPPTVSQPTWNQPFNIPATLYRKLLEPRVPFTVAAIYAATVASMNHVNKQRGNRPWAFSKTKAFKIFVILHNVFLTVYSLWTFAGMAQAFYQSWPDRAEKHNFVNIVDMLCKVNGPRGLGNAAIYDRNAEKWTMMSPLYTLGPDGVPDPTDVGRLWNKGLAFFGWLFYLSKFYEVIDTAIILAKGKKSSTLQTYHHAGAMMCMWAGMRYMAAPIWIFALFNSAIHAMMRVVEKLTDLEYFYYTLTALSVRVPFSIKRSLTTMQITQFLIGTTLAASYLFISYTFPVPVLHPVALSPLASAIPGALTAAPNDTAGGMGPWLKKLALRAAGAQGIAENVLNTNGKLFGIDGGRAAQAVLEKREIRYGLESRTFTCLDTTGQAFAVSLNVIYLLPLTFLFLRFFVRSYLHRTEQGGKHRTHVHVAEKAGIDAFKGVSREIRNAVMEMHGDEGGATDVVDVSGTSTPHPEAYEANINSIMTAKQLSAEQWSASIDPHPRGPRLAAPSYGAVTAEGTGATSSTSIT
ncbi:fatty acid elongase [Histoplasma capsulatum H143]|uniref:Elongation of fatty acids protein n=1 Tax=Ajellomyces capsulatus (strain H143) TaxID=544712 RepID=C6HNA5_AJECH|nr:fatty acid elongase [Histoplasma capsulatum H143]